MLKKLLKNTRFKSEIKGFFKENEEELIDIVLFGSSVKGKEKPKDIDILLIYKKKKNLDLDYELKNRLRKYYENVQIVSKTYKELFSPAFKAKEAFLSEGYSTIQDIFVSKGFGYINKVLFRYNLKNLNKSQRMRFYYSLYGRKKKEKGMLDKLDAVKFSETIILCSVENYEKMKEYLDNWNIDYIEFPILIPERIIELISK